MSLEQIDTVDAMGIETSTGQAVLTIADAWDWDNEHSHLLALQTKLNSYFGFIESGQVWESYPAAKGRELRIDVAFRFPPTSRAVEFLSKAADVASTLNVKVSHRTFRDSAGDSPTE